MPTYVYECEECGKVFEAEQRMSDDPLKDCDCGGKGTLRRLIQPTAMMFRGEGFHVNDYSPKDGKKAQAEPCGPDCACNPRSDDD